MTLLISQATAHDERLAIVDATGAYSYAELLDASARIASALLDGRSDLAEARVAFMVPPGFEYVATQWGIWRAGGIAVPLAVMHPAAELAHAIDDVQASLLMADKVYESTLTPLSDARGLRLWRTHDAAACAKQSLPSLDSARRAMILWS